MEHFYPNVYILLRQHSSPVSQPHHGSLRQTFNERQTQGNSFIRIELYQIFQFLGTPATIHR